MLFTHTVGKERITKDTDFAEVFMMLTPDTAGLLHSMSKKKRKCKQTAAWPHVNTASQVTHSLLQATEVRILSNLTL